MTNMKHKKPWFKNLAIDQPFMYFANGGGTPQGTFNPTAPGVPQMQVVVDNPYLNAPMAMEPALQEEEPIGINTDISDYDKQQLAALQGQMPTNQIRTNEVPPLGRSVSNKDMYYNLAAQNLQQAPFPEEQMPTDRFRTNQVPALGREPSGDERAKNIYYENMAGRGVGYAPETTPTEEGMQVDMNVSENDINYLKNAQQEETTGTGSTLQTTETTGAGNTLRSNELNPVTGQYQGPQTTELAPYPDAEQQLTEDVNNAVTEKEGFNANAYYMGAALVNSGLFARNLAQEPPPPIRMKKPSLERIRMDRTPYETARQEIREQGAQAMAGGRQQLSQMSDFLKMSQAVATGVQEQTAKLGTAEAQQELQVDMQNQQIANQENMMQTDTINQETMRNYQIQQEAQRYRDQVLSKNVAQIGDTAGAYAMYRNQKEQVERQEEIQRKQANIANDMQINWLKYEAAKGELSSEAYQEAERSAINQYIKESQAKLLADKEFQPLMEKFGENYDPTKSTQRYQKYAADLANYEYQMKYTEEPVRGENDNDEDWLKKQNDWKDFQAEAQKAKASLDEMKGIVDSEKKFYDRVRSEFDISGRRKDFQSSYLQQAGLPTTAEFIQSIESTIEANRQL